ncbi:PEP-CTERM sorting domain-containing protein [Sphaerotilus sp.]|uniref:PEP-CTERM sorting domain-containing protein n=1 Tax=Sphaerotilus sp. TaxID=2093942 RepID=UPI002ACE25C2|nr:PEP-CTERM sorting domain-containing protein [Sphaerotilus sp.]MDZ7856218.1 PEP-CTERM sorting domain-containing protein [Sphaerotilus sp.]
MIRKSFSTAVVAGLATFALSPAFALNNPGFEAGVGANPAGWITPLGTVTSVASGTTVRVIDDAYFPAPTEILARSVDAVSGNNFGLLETCPASTAALDCASNVAFSFNLGGPVSNVGDILWLRLFTADYLPADYNDSVTVSYFGASSASALNSDTLSVQTMADDGGLNTDSGWKGFAVPFGTQSLMVQINNVATNPIIFSDNLYNRPIVALDYEAAPVTPVPEAGTSAMMLAGLGVLGLVARRRSAARKSK